MKTKALFLIAIFQLYYIGIMAQTIEIKVKASGFQSSKGKAFFMLLDKNENEIEGKIEAIQNGVAECSYKVSSQGFYAIKAFHDINNNQKLDTNWLGIPKERWAVSNNVKATIDPPDFKKMLFEVKTSITISIHLQ